MPIYQSEVFDPNEVNKIYVLPVVDLRFDRSTELGERNDWVHKIIEKNLVSKDYNTDLLIDRSIVTDLIEEDLLEPDADRMHNLVNIEEARWLFIPYLLDSRSKMTFGSTGNAEVGAMMYDLVADTLIWRDKAIGKEGQGGLIGMALKGTMERSAIEKATKELMKSFPGKQSSGYN